MGSFCGSKKKIRNKILDYNSKSFSGTFKESSSLSDTSYGINNLNTRPETKIDNKRFTEYNELMKILYNNLTKTKLTNKKTIGTGGQSKIRKYYSQKYGEYVAEKVINIESSARATLGERGILNVINLLKEAVLLSGFKHNNIVKIYDYIEDPPTIIMEYCAKGSLRSILDKHIFLNPLYKIYLIYSICDGLKYVHSKGIVHGDLKCDNILLSDKEKYYIGRYYYPTPKLADFGLGQFHPNDVAAGTPGFIAPEVYKGSGLNFKTDIFALGMVRFEILSGLRPLPSDLNMAMLFLEQKKIPCTKEVLRRAWELRCEELLPRIKNNYFDKFYTIMIKCISDDPEDRPDISQIYSVVEKLYGISINVAVDLMDNQSNKSYY